MSRSAKAVGQRQQHHAKPRATILVGATVGAAVLLFFFLPPLPLLAALSIASWFSFVHTASRVQLRATRNNRLVVAIVVLLLTLVLPSPASADTLPSPFMVHVDERLGDDATCAPAGSACRTIGRGLEVAVANGVVMVASGTYSGTGNCDITITHPVTLISSEGQSKTFWDCEHKSRCLRILANATVQGFTFQRGFVAPIANCSDFDDPPEQRDAGQLALVAEVSSLNISRVDHHLGSPPLEGAQADMASSATAPLGVSREPQKSTQGTVSHVSPHRSNLFLALLVPSPVGVTSVPFRSANGHDLERALHGLSIQDLIALREAVLHIPLGEQDKLDKAAWTNKTGRGPRVAAAHPTVNQTTGPRMAGTGWSESSGEYEQHPTKWDSTLTPQFKMQHPHASPPHSIRATIRAPRSSRAQSLSTRFDDDSLTASAGGCILVAGVGLGVTISHSTIIGGIAPRGGGIAFNGTHALLSNVSVTSNNAEWGGGLLAVGGTLQIISSVISKNTAVNRGPVVSWPNNASVGAGVALFHVEHADVSSSSITRNTGTACGQCDENYNCPEATGGGISCSSGNVSVSSSHVTNNLLTCFGSGQLSSCHSAGGGIYLSGGNVSVSSSHVTNNSPTCSGVNCQSLGGGIYSSDGGIVSVSSSHVTWNVLNCTGKYCGSEGGGIYSQTGSHGSGGNVSVSSSHVTSNYLSGFYVDGGGIYSSGGIVSVSSSSHVTSNYLTSEYQSQGGGIYSDGGNVSVSSSHVASNYLRSDLHSSYGGGIITFRGNVSVSSSHVTDNSGTCSGVQCHSEGGGIWSYGGNVSVSSSHVSNNSLTCSAQGCSSEGGGISSSGGIVSVSSSRVTNNYLSGNDVGGGGIYNAGSVSVSSSHVASNYLTSKLKSYGGGIYSAGGIVSVSSSDLANNSVSAHISSQGGGIWSCCGVVLALEDVWLEGNHLAGANVEGGGLWIANNSSIFGSSSIVANNTFFRYNIIQAQGNGSGGGFYAVGFSDQLHVSVHFFGCEVAGNAVGAAAPGGRASGGAGEIVDTTLIMQHCQVQSNKASSVNGSTALGGGLTILGDYGAARLLDCSFTWNTGGDGGGLYVGASVHAARTFIGHNSASGQGGGVFLSQNASFVFSGNASHNRADHLGGTLFSAQDSSGRASLRMQGHALVEDGWAVVLPTLPNSSLTLEQFSSECLPGSLINVTMQQASRLTVNVSIDKGNFPTYLSVKPIFSIVTVAAVQCSPCQSGSYNLQGESHYPTGTNVAPSGAALASFTCHDCPYGGDCSRGGAAIVAQGGFWGHRNAQDGSVTFGPCPVGYCCAGSCKQFDQCAGHRTGTLCGACKQGTGEAWFSTQCKPTSQCTGDASWFIPVLLVVLAVYTAYFVHASTEPSSGLLGLLPIGIFFYQVVGYLHNDMEWEQSRAATMSFIQSSFLGGAFGGGSKSPGVCLVPGMSAVGKYATSYLVPVLVGVIMAFWAGTIRLVRRRAKPPNTWSGPLVRWFEYAPCRGKVAVARLLVFFYGSLITTSLQLLGPRDSFGDGNLYLFIDGNIDVPQVWQLGPLLLLLVLVPFPLLLSHYVHQRRVAEPDLASALTGAFSPERHYWLAIMLYQRFVLALIASVVPEPTWRGLLLTAVSICNLALALHFRPFRTRSAQGIYVTLLTMLAIIALFALPSLDRKSLATSNQFGRQTHLFMEWLQFVLVLSPLAVALVTTVAGGGCYMATKATKAALLFKGYCHHQYLRWRGNSSVGHSLLPDDVLPSTIQ